VVAGLVISNEIIVNLFGVDPHVVLWAITTLTHKVLNRNTTTTLALPLIQQIVNKAAILICINRWRPRQRTRVRHIRVNMPRLRKATWKTG
jgi:hypothetical protein